MTWADLDLDSDLDLVLANGGVPVTDLASDADCSGLRHRRRPLRDVSGRWPARGRPEARARERRRRLRQRRRRRRRGRRNRRSAACSRTRARGKLARGRARRLPPGRRGHRRAADGRKLRREVVAGSSYLSSEDPRVHFGLGRDERGAGRRALAGRWRDAPPTSTPTRCSRWTRRSEPRGVVCWRSSRSPGAPSAGATRPTSPPTARVPTSGGARWRASGTRRCSTRSGVTFRRRRCTRATSSTRLRRCGTRGRPTTPRRRLLRPREARRRRRRGCTRGGAQLRRVPDPPPPLLARGRVAGDLRRADLDDAQALLPDRLRERGGRLAGRARKPHRRRGHRFGRNDGAHEQQRYVDTDYKPANAPLVVEGGGDDARPEPVAAARARQDRRAERRADPGPGATFVGPHWGHVRGFALPPPTASRSIRAHRRGSATRRSTRRRRRHPRQQ